MIEVLRELAELKECACFYSSPQVDKFKYGIVLAVNEKEIALGEISPDGEDDGIVVLPTVRIYRIERNSWYVKKMEKLCSGRKNSSLMDSIDENNILISVLSNSNLLDQIVSIELQDSGYYSTTGFVEQVKNDKCIIRQIDDYGFEDGVTYLLVDDITELVVSSDLEKRIQRLWRINSKKTGKKTGDGSVD